jgi:NAD(P)-dependent dehydrogenase (short-subunit alcohol dehydrogenase family)
MAMDLELRGKVALVTGSTAGIGLAIAQALAAEGAEVVVNGRTQRRVDDAVRAVKESTTAGTVRGIAADLGTREGADRLIAALPSVDVLVNNLGIFEAKPFVEITDADWMTMFETNVLSGVRLARHYFPGMLTAGWGRVIFISSESAVQIPSEMIHYGMTKTAQVAIARGLAEMTKGTAVTVNSVLAGPTRSEGVEQFIEQLARSNGTDAAGVEKEFFATMRPTSLLKRFEDPAEIGTVVAFLASPKASAINGAAVRAEGGVVQAAL